MIGKGSNSCKDKFEQKCTADDNPFQISFGDLEVVHTDASGFSVSGNDHGKMYVCNHVNETNRTIDIVVTPPMAYLDGHSQIQVGTIILFVQNSDSKLNFINENGVNIISPGLLESYTKGSTVTLVSVAGNEWVLGGDVKPLPEIIGAE